VLVTPTPRWSDRDVSALPRVLNPARDVGDRLDRLIAAMVLKMDLKNAVVADVLAGRLSLADGAARFREIEARCPELERIYRTALRLHNADCRYEVAVARNLVAVARERLERDPSPDPAVLPRLERELAALPRR
jgi:hypothetical protein